MGLVHAGVPSTLQWKRALSVWWKLCWAACQDACIQVPPPYMLRNVARQLRPCCGPKVRSGLFAGRDPIQECPTCPPLLALRRRCHPGHGLAFSGSADACCLMNGPASTAPSEAVVSCFIQTGRGMRHNVVELRSPKFWLNQWAGIRPFKWLGCRARRQWEAERWPCGV